MISPFKHYFTKADKKRIPVKVNNCHVYERDKYSMIIKNILVFDIHFKSIMAYHILTNFIIEDSIELEIFLRKLESNVDKLPSVYNKRLSHMKLHFLNLKNDISKCGNVYCFCDY